jgi:RHS repeat-associated protein
MAGNTVTLTAVDPDHDGNLADNQVTVYNYFDAYNPALATRIKYPDSASAEWDAVMMAYDLDGALATKTSQRKAGETATVIAFDYDTPFRRLAAQRVTAVGTGVDDAVKSMGYTYDLLGRREKVTSYIGVDTTTTALNEVLYTYNKLGLLENEYQEHAGAKVGGTLYVVYGYDETSDGNDKFYTNSMRPKSVQYPNTTRTVYTLYVDSGGGSGIGDKVSRVTAIASADSRGTNDANVYAAYAYNGAGRIVEDAHPNVTNGLTLTYTGVSGGLPYPGFDLFGRVVWQAWRKTTGTANDRYFYGYDRASNRIWRAERSDATVPSGRDEAYAYDSLGRLIEAQRGTLPGRGFQAPIGGDANRDGVVNQDDYDLMSMGAASGWGNGDFNGDGIVNQEDYGIADYNQAHPPDRAVTRSWQWYLDGVGNWPTFKEGTGTAWTLEQTRTNNLANEITGISQGGGQAEWVVPQYDARGNMISGPKPGAETTRIHLKYDAWNRMVQAKNADGSIIATYRYDGTGRRIRKLLGADPENPTATYDYYHNPAWQVLETRKNASANPYEQFVWSLRYVHAPVLRWFDPDTDGQNVQTHYYCNDANFNVTALVGTDGAVVERYTYDPYGKVTFRAPDWSERSSSSFSNDILFTGHRLDTETGLYYGGWRYYHPTLGRWTTWDRIVYRDGMNLCQYVGSAPMGRVDANGTQGILDYFSAFQNPVSDWLGEQLYELGEGTPEMAAAFFAIGGGPRTYNYKPGDAFLETVKNDPFMEEVRGRVRETLQGRCKSPACDATPPPKISYPHEYKGKGITGDLELMRDYAYAGTQFAPYSPLPALGATKASAYLGTYNVECTASDIKCCRGKAKIAFHVWDFWNAPTLSNLPFVGPRLGESPLGENGPIGGTTWLYFDWEEEITFTGDRNCAHK